MGKAKPYGMNKPYVKNGRGDHIHIKTQMHFARGGDKPKRSMELLLKHLARTSKDNILHIKEEPC